MKEISFSKISKDVNSQSLRSILKQNMRALFISCVQSHRLMYPLYNDFFHCKTMSMGQWKHYLRVDVNKKLNEDNDMILECSYPTIASPVEWIERTQHLPSTIMLSSEHNISGFRDLHVEILQIPCKHTTIYRLLVLGYRKNHYMVIQQHFWWTLY